MKKWLALVLSFSLLTFSGTAGAIEAKTTKILNKNVTYVSFKTSEGLELVPVLAQNKVGKTEQLSQMGKRHQALAAINGTFFNPYDPNDLQPQGAVMANHRLEHFRGGQVALGIKENDQMVFASSEGIRIRGGINGSREWPLNWYAWFMNHSPSSTKEIVIFTPSYRTLDLTFASFTYVVVQQNKVSAIVKNKAAVPTNGYVIAIGDDPQNKDQLSRFHVGDSVEYWLEMPDALTSIKHLITGGPKLVTNGKVDVNFAGFKEEKITKNAGQRSFIGVKKDQTMVIGTVPGVTVRQLADIAVQMGIVEAMNLDGGASSGLYYNGKYLTKPGRNLSNSLVVIKKKSTPIPPIQVKINGQLQHYDQSPIMVQGRTLVPLRGIFEALGAQVQWDSETQTVTAVKGEVSISLVRGAREAFINGQSFPLDVPANTTNGRMMVPTRFVSETLGANVKWDGLTRTVMIAIE